jgi:exonuclease III
VVEPSPLCINKSLNQNQSIPSSLNTTNLNHSSSLNCSNTNENYRTLKIVTFNTHGIKTNYITVNALAELNDVVLVQESMCLNDQIMEQLITVPNRSVYVKKASESEGRPIGGLIIIVKSTLKHTCYFERLNIGVLILGKLAIINVYLIHNANTAENANEFNLQLLELSKVRKKLLNNVNEVVIMGDTNVDVHRVYKTNVIETVCSKTRRKDFSNFLKNNSLICADLINLQRIWFTFWQIKNGKINTSVIDHVMLDRNFKFDFSVNVIYSKINRSDHNPIQLNLELENKQIEESNIPKIIKKSNWANPMFNYEYKCELMKLLKIHMNEASNFEHKTDIRTKRYLEQLVSNIVESTKKAEIIASFKVGDKNKHKKIKPWWDDELINHHVYVCTKQIEWAQTEFKDNNKHKELKTARKEFNKLNKYKEKLKRNARIRNLDKLFRLNKQEFWSQMRKMKRDNKKLNVDIDKMKQKYEDLFNNSLINNEARRLEAERIINEFFENESEDFKQIEIRPTDIENILKKLANNKKSGISGISNEHLKYGSSDELIFLLKQLFQTMINTGVFPDEFNISLITPLIKDKNVLDDPNNTRPISVADALTNLFERILLKLIDSEKKDEEEQFGFKSNSSCGHAITVLLDAALYNRRKALRLYVVAIDATKAFDKVNRTILWANLVTKLSKTTIRALMNYYAISKAMVDMNRVKSQIFKTTVGVKQGGSLSPRLFSIYIEDLIVLLRKSKWGMVYESDEHTLNNGLRKKMVKRKIECLFYADDILVVATIKKELENLLLIVEEYGKKFEILFNVGKTYTMTFNNKIKRSEKNMSEDGWQDDLKLNGNVITKTSNITYLGVEISEDLRNNLHLEKRRTKSLAAFFILKELGLTSNCISIKMKAQMYKTFIRPVLFYGLENLDLNKTERDGLQRLESNLVKMCIGISKYCYSSHLLLALNIDAVQVRLIINKCSFFIRLSKNGYTRKHLKSQLNTLKKLDFPEKMKCSINCIRNILLETNKGNLIFELDFEVISLKEMVKKCENKISEIKLKNSYLSRYSNEINEIRKLIDRDDKRVALKLIEDKLLPEKFKFWLASKQKLSHSIRVDDDFDCLIDFNESIRAQ